MRLFISAINRLINYRWNKRKLGLALLVILLFFGCCGNEKEGPQKLVNQARELAGLGRVYSQIAPKKVAVLADISGSMAGFVKASDFPIRMSALHSSLAGVDRQYFTLSGSVDKVSDHISLQSDELYDGKEANYGLINDIIDSSGAIIVLTDLQFNNRTYYSRMVSLFQELIEQNKYVRISASIAPFDGLIYTQSVQPKRIFQSAEERPLYAIVVCEKKYSDYVDAVLATSGIWEQHLPLSLDQASKQGIKLVTHVDGKDHVKIRLENSAIRYWDTIAENNILFETFPIVKGNVQAEPARNRIELNSMKVSDQLLTLDFNFEKHRTSQPHLLAIKIKPSMVPSWIIDLSCSEQGDGSNQATKTLWLDRFVEEVISPVKNPFIMINEFTTIGDIW